jgi:1,4-alpha-glucan branching enzyme
VTRSRPAPYELADPHAYLGAHAVKGGVMVRAYRPDAESIRVLPMGVELDQRDGNGVFEGVVKGAELPLEYELQVSYPAGDSYVLRDPYSFLPTLGELDVHLAGEGRHEELYARLGAHPRVGLQTPARSAWWATSTAGTGGCIRCAPSVRPASGKYSFPTSGRE